jgi:hypothetical protein
VGVECINTMHSILVTNMCSKSPPGGNPVDGLPPVSNTAVRDIRFKLGLRFLCARTRSRSFLQMFLLSEV